MIKKPMDFIDTGASDDEPAKGVTNGHLREWHDEIEKLKADCGHWAADYDEITSRLSANRKEAQTAILRAPTPENIRGES